MKYTETEIDDMIASLQNTIEYLHDVLSTFGGDLADRNRIKYDLHQLHMIERLLLHIENED